jgi:tape measure domain-containing protein
VSIIGNVNVQIGANTSGLSKGLVKAETEVGGFGSSIMSLAGKGAALGAGFLGLTTVLGKLGDGIKGAADMEQAEISFGVLFKSADTAKAVLGDLSKFASETPFELPELTNAGRSLAAFGFEAGAIVPNLRMIGDIASGVGQPIGELAELYGKAKVQGRLFGEDINQLTGRGIPITQALAKQFGVSEDKVKGLVEAGKIGFPQLEAAFRSMTGAGGQFNGMMAAQSQSLSGLWSTLQDGIGGALRDLSGYLMAAFDAKGGIAAFTAGIETARSSIASLEPFFLQLVNTVGTVMTSIGEGFSMIAEGASIAFGYVGDTLGSTVGGMGDQVLNLMSEFEWVFSNIGNLVALTWENMKLGAVGFFEDLKHILTVQLPAIWSWLSDDWSATWQTMLDYTLTVLTNLGTNIRSAMQEIWDWIKSGGRNAMEFAWTPLTEGAVSAMKELPDIPDRAISELEKSLQVSVDSMGNELGGSLLDHIEKRRDEILGPGGTVGSRPSAAMAGLPTFPTSATSSQMTKSAATEAPKLAGAFVKGSLEEASLRNKIEAGSEFKEMVSLAKKQLDETKKQTTEIKNQSKVSKPILVGPA